MLKRLSSWGRSSFAYICRASSPTVTRERRYRIPSSTSVASQRVVVYLIARRSHGVFPWHSPAVPASSIAAVTWDAPQQRGTQQRSPSRDTIAPRCTFRCAPTPFALSLSLISISVLYVIPGVWRTDIRHTTLWRLMECVCVRIKFGNFCLKSLFEMRIKIAHRLVLARAQWVSEVMRKQEE